MSKEFKVAKVGEIQPGTCMQVEVEGEPIGIYNLNGEFFAISDTCTHAQAYLSEGTVEGSTVTCPWHGAEFDIKSGKNLKLPAPAPLEKYAVKIDGDDIKIVL